tara:strand:+ start:180 stop:701 length:522 start_codon:yes stop_codon:yes gene_type:complete
MEFRNITDRDKQFIDVDISKKRHKKTSRELFQLELIKQEQEATKKRLPFARNQAREDFERLIKEQVDEQLKLTGEVDADLIKVPELDWASYSDLKNFKVLDEGDRYDENLSNKNPGLTVEIKKVVYQFKDYATNKYTIMESGPDAVKRAQDKSWKDRAAFEKSQNGTTENKDK